MKSAFSTQEDGQHCDDFAHIHHFHKSKNNHDHKTTETCKSGKVLATHFLLGAQHPVIPVIVFSKVQVSLDFIDNSYLSPYLDTPKQPPKHSA